MRNEVTKIHYPTEKNDVGFILKSKNLCSSDLKEVFLTLEFEGAMGPLNSNQGLKIPCTACDYLHMCIPS